MARDRAPDRAPAAVTSIAEPHFSADWLALREPADAAARSTELAGAVCTLLSATPVIRDLGAGTAAMGRWLAPRLAHPGHWILHDRDPELLSRAWLPQAATVQTCVGGLPIVPVDTALAGTSLVTASALLDLLRETDVRQLAGACGAAGCAALLTLSVTGVVRFTPSDPFDDVLAAAFNQHQREQLGLGPDAVTVAAAAFTEAGYRVSHAPSPWSLGPGERRLAHEWLRGWVGAAVAQRPGLRAQATTYLHRRLSEPFHVLIGHEDLLAVPDGAAPDGAVPDGAAPR